VTAQELPPHATCSALARDLAEPLAGTATEALGWLCLEQPGPWGAKALTESHLDAGLGAELEARAAAHGIRAGLIRRPGPHADGPGPRQVRLSYVGDAADRWVAQLTVADPADLLALDLAALAGGVLPPGARAARDPLFLVCTNGRRDRCCAERGREAVAELLTAFPAAEVWESSHLGGHRFGPVIASLPDGFLFGGPAALTFTTSACRGRSALSAPAQVAELAVLEQVGVCSPLPLAVGRLSDDEWAVTEPEGARWRVTVTESAILAAGPESCGREPLTRSHWVVGRMAPWP
jgi:hypothetical protein